MMEVQETNAGSARRRSVAHNAPGIGELAAELARLGVRARLLRTPAGFTAGGAALRVAVSEVLAAQPAREGLLQRLALLLKQEVPVTLHLSAFGAGDTAIGALEVLCGFLRNRLRAVGLSTQGLGVSVHSHVLPLPAYTLVCGALLGGGPRYVMLDGLQLRHHEDEHARSAAERNWSFLWQRRKLPPSLIPAYASAVTTRCPLLGDEAAVAVLPEAGLQVPPETAWLPLEVALTDFSDGQGELRLGDLEAALRLAVDKADELLDYLYWPLPELAADAWQARWRQALANAAVRHRNMLVMSPYSMLPRSVPGTTGYADLLPVLHHADAFCFAAPRGDAFKNRSEFISFHRRAWAVMQRRNAASLVAAGV